MSLSVVQHSTSNTGTVTLTNPVGSGNTVVAFLYNTTGTLTFTDDKVNTYTNIDTVVDTPDGIQGKSFLLGNITNGPRIFSGVLNTIIFIIEIGGALAASNSLDGHAGQLQNTVGTGSGAVTSGSFTTTTAALVVGSTFSVTLASTISPFTGFTTLDNDVIDAAQSEFLILGAPGSTAVQFTAGTAGSNWITLGMGVKPTAGDTFANNGRIFFI